MSARTLVPVAMVSVLLMTTAAFAQTGGGGSPVRRRRAIRVHQRSAAQHRTRPAPA